MRIRSVAPTLGLTQLRGCYNSRMRFHADLHVHSRYSRATSRDADLEHLALWAARKGITVVATGDFTHPAWMAELKEKLVPAEPGVFRLRPEIEREVMRQLPAACQTPVRFMLSVEISTIYKKGESTRKIHHLLYAPNFDSADRIVARLARIGNLTADGRPILGLDSRNLLEITLESHPASYLVPAHIWTPWFAVLGSKSGFDSIVDCYGDLSDQIFALETGLSSDPPMNWRLSMLDRYRLVSNSDAHSPPKLGRETTLFDGEIDYFAIRDALRTGSGYVGTVEFFPEEGKYHLDGHRRCGIRQTPQETHEHDGRCLICGQPTTVGVLNRINALADRPEGNVVPPATAGEVHNLVPLPEILAELAGTGVGSKSVERSYDRLVTSLGSELTILETIPVEDIARTESSLLAEAITRLRDGRVICNAGYDGEYGVIKLFEERELRQHTKGGLLFDVPPIGEKPLGRSKKATRPAVSQDTTDAKRGSVKPRDRAIDRAIDRVTESAPLRTHESSSPLLHTGILGGLDDDQRVAASTVTGPLLIIAGPGSGKTRTLTHRIAHLVVERDVPASKCLAITFTRRAAAEMRERLGHLIPERFGAVPLHTFHSLGLSILRENPGTAGLQHGFHVATDTECLAILSESGLSERKAASALRAISKAKRTRQPLSDDIANLLERYREGLSLRNWIDVDDLVGLTVDALSEHPDFARVYRDRFQSISADEFQDVDAQQYRLLALLNPSGDRLCVIGDPDQAIYGFRGADASCFDRLMRDYPTTTVVRLARNYRSSGTIVKASAQVIATSASERDAEITAMVSREMLDRITIHAAPTDRGEAEFVVHTIESLIGGHTFFSIDSGRAKQGHSTHLSFSDFAVLYRTDAQAAVLCQALARSGIPFRKHSHELLVDRSEIQAILQEFEREAAAEPSQTLSARLTAAADRVMSHGGDVDSVAVQSALHRLLAIADLCAYDPVRFSDTMASATEMDSWDPGADQVSLLTIHAAKGLEFPIVFMTGLEDGVLPLYWGDDPPDTSTLEEERRLCYVGMTRARDRLILTRASERPWRGRVRSLEPSPFLHAIQQELVKHEQVRARRPVVVDTQLSLL